MKINDPAAHSTIERMDGFGGSIPFVGDIASVLLANNFDVRCLRPHAEQFAGNSLAANASLRKDEWMAIDEAVIGAATVRLNAVADLMSRGLTKTIPNGLGQTVLYTETESDLEAATLGMDPAVRQENDTVDYASNYLPLPVAYKDFSIGIRELNASRRDGTGVDTTNATIAARKVGELIESTLLNGSSTFTFGGGAIYGYVDEPQRNTYSLSAAWSASAASGATMLADVLGMVQAAVNDRHYGPFVLYIPTAWQTAIGDDFKAASDKAIRERLGEVASVEAIKVADQISGNNCFLVQMTPDVTRIVDGLQITTVRWSSEGGMRLHFKVMAIMVPQVRHDYDNRSGVVHGS